MPVTINGGELAVGNGVNATGNHQLAALILNGGTISGDILYEGRSITAMPAERPVAHAQRKL
jgi:hypothetical protein